jgi:hypothetical protein
MRLRQLRLFLGEPTCDARKGRSGSFRTCSTLSLIYKADPGCAVYLDYLVMGDALGSWIDCR